MVPIEHVLLTALGQTGDPYIFGVEASALDPDPDGFDCSELVEWSCHRSGIADCPDGAFNQWRWSILRRLSVDVGMQTRGALLFVGDGTGTGRDAITHVAWSLGNGTTIEARGAKWGVGTWPSVGRFDFAARIPGATYSPLAPPPPKPTPIPSEEDDAMTFVHVTDSNRFYMVNGTKVTGLSSAEAKQLEADGWHPRKMLLATWNKVT